MLTIQQIIDYLSEHISDPVPHYLFIKEILKKPLSSPEYLNAYNKIVQTNWYRELADEQNEDGSWGAWRVDGYRDRAVAEKLQYHTYLMAFRRAKEMGLTKDDPMMAKGLGILEKYITGEAKNPWRISLWNDEGKTNTIFRNFYPSAFINLFDPYNPLVKPLQESTAEVYRTAFATGYFNDEYHAQAESEYQIYCLAHPRNTPGLKLMQQAKCMEEPLERHYLNYVWGNTSAINTVKVDRITRFTHHYVTAPDTIMYMSGFLPIHKKNLEDKEFTVWLSLLELLSGFSLFGEFMRDEAYPHLLGEADRLINSDVELPKPSSGHVKSCGCDTNGRYAESWRDKNKRKTDMVLRITRILMKCSS